MMAPKKLFEAITGWKYDPDHKPTKAEKLQKEADQTKPSPKKDKSTKGEKEKQQTPTPEKRPEKATPDTTAMDTMAPGRQ